MNRKQKLKAEIEATKLYLNLLQQSGAPDEFIDSVLQRLKATLDELEKLEDDENPPEETQA